MTSTDDRRPLSTGVTKQQHDELVAAKGRPLTQEPIRRRLIPTEQPNPDTSPLDQIIDEAQLLRDARRAGQ